MERCSFFNAELNGETYDRVYLAEDFARYFSSFIGNGVFPNPATGLQVIADNKSMNVIIKPGKAWINGYFYENTDDLTLQVSVADGVLNRIDRVVLRLDFLNREIKAYIKKGNFAITPVTPTITRNADLYELALADIRIDKGTIKIDQASITDLRFNKELCGVVKGTIEEIDTTDLFLKFEQGFEAWFEYMKGTIEGDAAANLTNKVYELNSKLNTKADATQIDDLNSKLNTKATKDGTLQANLNAEKVGGTLASELALKSELNDTNNEIKKINNSKAAPLGIATLDNNNRLLQDINYNKIIGNSNLKKEEVIAKGTLTAPRWGKNDSKAIPINVGEWLQISIKVNYTLYGSYNYPDSTTSKILITNTVDGEVTTLKEESDSRGRDEIKGTYSTQNGEAWAMQPVNSLIDIYRCIGITGTDWGKLKNNKTNTITIEVSRTATSGSSDATKAIADYTITGIRR